MELLLVGLAFTFGLAFVGGEFAARARLPRSVGQLVAGIIAGIPFFSHIVLPAGDAISSLGELGIVFLLLLAGMRTDPAVMIRLGRDVTAVSILSVLLPFALGASLAGVLGYGWMVAVILGAALAITAEGTTIEVLQELRLLGTKVGAVILGAGILDDIFELLFLSAVVVFLEHSSAFALFEIPFRIAVFLLVAYVAYRTYPWLLRRVSKRHSELLSLSWIVLFALVTAVLSELLGTGYVIGAFVAGFIIRTRRPAVREYRKLLKDLELITFAVVVPFFFVSVGMLFDIGTVASHLPLVGALLLVAVIGKVGGALLAYPFTDLSWRQLFFVGWGMNSRGAVELIAAEIAFTAGLLPLELFSAIVAMSVITTMLFPLMASRITGWALTERPSVS